MCPYPYPCPGPRGRLCICLCPCSCVRVRVHLSVPMQHGDMDTPAWTLTWSLNTVVQHGHGREA
jgi:hypothetical protein